MTGSQSGHRSSESFETLDHRLRRISLAAERLAGGRMAGAARSLFRGHGLDFSDVRTYVPGDDVRHIDWRVTARSADPYVRQFEEERDRSVFVLVDASGSMNVGDSRTDRGGPEAPPGSSKWNTASDLAILLALIASFGRSPTQISVVGDYQPLRAVRGTGCVLRAAKTLFHTVPAGGDAIDLSLEQIAAIRPEPATLILVTDWFWTPNSRARSCLSELARRHELWVFPVCCQEESRLPNCGLLRMQDPETGQKRIVDTSSDAIRNAYAAESARRRAALQRTLATVPARVVEISTALDLVTTLSTAARGRT